MANDDDDNAISKWTKGILDGRSSRWAELKTSNRVSYGTIENLKRGKQVDVNLFIIFAETFKQDVIESLRLCGYDEMVRVLREYGEGGGNADTSPIEQRNETVDEGLTYEPLTQDEEEVVSFYRGINPIMRPAAKASLKALLDSMPDAEDWTTFGKKAE